MPSSDFIEIGPGNHDDLNNLMNKLDKSAEKSSASKKNPFKQPLTEHQKEVRRKKSFIPMEVQSVCCVLEPTMDSQMSCTMDDTQDTQSQVPPVAKSLNFDVEKTDANVIKSPIKQEVAETQNESKNQMDIDKSITETEVSVVPGVAETSKEVDDEDYLIANMSANNILEIPTPSSSLEVEKRPAESGAALLTASSSSNSPSVINFKSKIKPNKKIELFEVKREESGNKETNEALLDNVVVVDKAVEPVVEAVVQPEVEPVVEAVVEKVEKPECEMASSRRRSTRLSTRVKEPQASETDEGEDAVEMTVETSSSSQKEMEESMSECVTKLEKAGSDGADAVLESVNADEILDQLNEDCKNAKIDLKSLRLRRRADKTRKSKSNVLGIDHRQGIVFFLNLLKEFIKSNNFLVLL